jgi:nucleotide-binding universal stress UspA family protein
MKTILVPTDGSAAAEKALDLALDLAEKHDADIKLMHVLLRDKEPFELLRLPDIEADQALAGEIRKLASGPGTPRSAAELMANPNLPERPAPEPLLRTIGASVLSRAHARAAGRGVRVDVLDVADGATAPSIATAATAQDADTIVMGMRGLRYSDALTFGSVSQEVCRSVDCTCVAVH